MTIQTRRLVRVDSGNALNYAGGQEVRAPLPRNWLVHRILVFISGTVTISVAGTSVLHEDGIFALLRRIAVAINGRVPIQSYAGATLRFLNRIMYGVTPPNLAPGVGIAAHPFSFTLAIPFERPDTPFGRRFALPAYALDTLDLIFQWGDETDCFTTRAGVTYAWALNPPEVMIEGEDPARDEKFRQVRVQERIVDIPTVVSVPDGLAIDLDRDAAAMRALTVIARDNSLRSDALVTREIVEFDTDRLADITNGLLPVHGDTMRRNALPVGVNTILFDRDGTLKGLPQFQGRRSAQLRLVHIAATTVGEVRVIAENILSGELG